MNIQERRVDIQRVGRFRVRRQEIFDFPELVRTFFRELDPIIVEARFLYDFDAIEYMVLSDKFGEVEWDHPAPLYPIDLTFEEKVGDGTAGSTDVYIELTKLTLGKPGEKSKRIHIPLPF